jgi:hypothetical protein
MHEKRFKTINIEKVTVKAFFEDKGIARLPSVFIDA